MADVSKERRAVRLLFKKRVAMPPSRKQYVLRYFWYNPHDPCYLRYAKDADMRFVKVIPIKESAMKFKANRTKHSAEVMTLNCQKKFKIKFSQGGVSWTLYFQSQKEYDDWLDLFAQIRALDEESLRSMLPRGRDAIQENWYESRYGQGSGRMADSNGNASMHSDRPRSPGASPSSPPSCSSPVLARRTPLMVIVELPEALGFVRTSLDRLDTQVITIKRFKERLFESAHLHLHQAHHLTNGQPSVDEAKSSSKYTKKVCESCGGMRRQMLSRQMYRQEECLNLGPEHFVFQVGSIFTVKDYQPVDADSVHISNERFTTGGGLYEQFPESTEDDLLLRSFEFVSAALGTKPISKEDSLDWVEDESLALSALVERTAPNRPSLTSRDPVTTVIHLVVRPSRELPLKRFFVNITRYTREYDAMTSFSLYVANVRHGDMRWEIRRRFSDFKELDTALREEAAKDDSKKWKLPAKLPAEARRPKFRSNAENDELRVIRDLNVYIRQMVSDNDWDPPPVALLSFLGIVNTGKNSLMNSSVTRKRRVCHLDALAELAEPGDIVLFRSVNPMAGLQRVVTGRCTFDHIGLVVKRKRNGYELLEATGEGVTAYPLEDRLEAYSAGFCDLIALRKIRFERTPETSSVLADFTSQVEGKPYRLTLTKLASSRLLPSSISSSSRKTAYFCSELVAEALRKIGVMSTTGRPDSYFLPHFFDEGGLAEKYLTDGCALDDIIFVDCHNPEIKYSKPSPNKAA